MTPFAQLTYLTVPDLGAVQLADGRALLHERRVEKLPILNPQGKLIGLVTAQDILKLEQHPQATKDGRGRLRVAAAVGVRPEDLLRAEACVAAGADVLVLDIAHGHADHALNMVRQLKQAFPETEVIAGNVATAEGRARPGGSRRRRRQGGRGLWLDLHHAHRDRLWRAAVHGDHGLRRGRAGGGRAADRRRRDPQFGRPDQGPGSGRQHGDDRQYAGRHRRKPGRQRGARRAALQDGARHGLAERQRRAARRSIRARSWTPGNGSGWCRKGVEAVVPYRGEAGDILHQLVGGLRSGMSYAGACTIEELQENAEFIRMSSGRDARKRRPRRGENMNWKLFLGSYTQRLSFVNGTGRGIYSLEMDTESGALHSLRLAHVSTNPSFVALHPTGQYLYAVNELERYRGHPGGAISAYAVQPGGRLKKLNQRGTGGGAPCHICVDPAGQALLVANYVGGSLAWLPLEADGRLGKARQVIAHQGRGPNAERQEAPHVHSTGFAPGGRLLLAADLGIDRVVVYAVERAKGAHADDPYGKGAHAEGAPEVRPYRWSGRSSWRRAPGRGTSPFTRTGAGCTFSTSWMSTLAVFAYEAGTPAFNLLQTIPSLPAGYSGMNTAAHVALHPGGRWLYASNRGHDSLAIFRVGDDGRLESLGRIPSGGRAPRHFALTPDGKFLVAANQNSDALVVFRVNLDSGLLEETGIRVEVPTPVCVVIGYTEV